jgi:hypothetical protein
VALVLQNIFEQVKQFHLIVHDHEGFDRRLVGLGHDFIAR